MRLVSLFLIVFFSTSAANAQHDPNCPVTEVRFPKGSSGTVISGMVPAEGILCFDLNVREGQRVTMQVIEGRNTIFSVYDVSDAQRDLEFAAPSNRVQFLVGQLMRAVNPQQFRIEIAVR